MKIRLFTLVLLFIVQNIFAQIEGTWKGDLLIQGVNLPLIIEIKTAENGYQSTLYSPKQSSQGIPTSKTTFENSELVFESSLIQAHYKGLLKNDKIEGIFTQNGMELPLILERTEAVKIQEERNIPNLGNRAIDTEKLSKYIDYFAKEQKAIGSISIVRNGKKIYRKDFGQNQLPIKNYDQNTAYQVGSITKLFLATMIMQDVEKGKLSLDDKLSKFYPNLPNADKITIKNMLNHSSGLGDYVLDGQWLMNETVSENAILDTIAKQGVLFEPNEKVKYSNSAYYLLCKIVERSNKKPFNVLLKDRITKKLKMKNTFSVLDKPKNIFASYRFVDDKYVLVEDFNFINSLGAGDITATTSDLNLFIQALFDGKLLKKETVNAMLPTDDKVFGLCIMRIPFYNQIFYGHGGTTLGTDASVAYNPTDDITFSLCINSRGLHSTNEFTIGILSVIYDETFEFGAKKQKPQFSY